MIQSRPYRLLLAGTLLWCLAIVAVPLLATTDHALARGGSAFLQDSFSHVCHRLTDRSFHLAGEPLGVCVRCTSIYGGFFVGLLLYPLFAGRIRRALPSRWWLVGAALPTGLDAVLNLLGLWASTEPSRALTGALLGIALSAYIVPLLAEAFSGSPRQVFLPRRIRTEKSIWMNDQTNSASPS